MSSRALGEQFSAYRGLHLPVPFDPSDPEDVVSRLRARTERELSDPGNDVGAWPIFGQHWSTDPRVAREFALNMGDVPGSVKSRDTQRPSYGIVLEARSPSPPRGLASERHGFEHEVWPPRRDEIAEVLAHAHVAPPGSPRQRRLAQTLVATHVVPPDVWRRA